ncbi:YuzB family protein [Aneurinibacillus sp. Ricciae_BoGa-3]|uniref:YuzB family protein n=1 Tax=Aneurinibacillus sp. Ricciae_BoGa-3 TaxID=3022697 RepID=UPI00234213BF|nr:YuzB family protein [Aneurinibacillus sp. Ricciae_BoGa-3]WCK56886.1 YuzB family protein [Aneurinibacillus sp. Ricciae_BoGa-3]
MVEFCVSNLSNGSDRVKKVLEEEGEVDILEYGCLGNCGQCFIQPYALVEGKLIAADTPDELLIAIKEYLKQKQDEDKLWEELGF